MSGAAFNLEEKEQLGREKKGKSDSVMIKKKVHFYPASLQPKVIWLKNAAVMRKINAFAAIFVHILVADGIITSAKRPSRH